MSEVIELVLPDPSTFREPPDEPPPSLPDCVQVYDPHGFVRLVDWCCDEISVIDAARVSLHKSSEWELDEEGMELLTGLIEDIRHPSYVQISKEFYRQHGRLNEADKGLINFLLSKKHGTPFEQGFMAAFHIRVPIFVMREWIRHRVGFSYNEESGRYVEMRPDFFIPEEVRTQQGKPGAYTFERIEDPGIEEWFKGMLKYHSEKGFDLYKEAMEYGIAKEQARLFLGLNLYTEFRWTCNARSLMNFLSLRNDPPAMQEIRTYAGAIEGIFAEKMPTVHAAFEAAGRVAP